MLGQILNLFFPPQCLNCRALVTANGTLCLECWQNVRFITDPLCHCCGHPFDFDLGAGALCGECMREAPPFAMARAAFRYDEHSRALVLRLKYGDQLQLAPVYGAWLAKAGKELVAASDVIVPVPLHYWRFVGRRYNQSAVLAAALSKKTGLLLLPDALKRTRRTQPQASLTRRQRLDNVHGAFAPHPHHGITLKGKSVLLIDDVMTSSATASACSEALLKAGARAVHVLTLARTFH